MVDRRALLRALAAAPAALLASETSAADYANAPAVFTALETLSKKAEARLAALAGARPRAGAFVSSVRADLLRHRRERQDLARRRKIGLEAAPPEAPVDEPRSLPLLRSALEELMHAHAEGLPALRDPVLVQGLASHLVDLSRHVTVVDLWMEMESPDE